MIELPLFWVLESSEDICLCLRMRTQLLYSEMVPNNVEFLDAVGLKKVWICFYIYKVVRILW